MTSSTPKADLHQKITQQLLSMLETAKTLGDCPWYCSGHSGRPGNAKTKGQYRGINILVLWAASMECGYGSGQWATFRQWKNLGAQVRKGEKGTPVIFYKELDVKDDEQKRFVARASHVFAAEQVDGFTIEDLPTVNPVLPAQSIEAILNHHQVVVQHCGERAFYQPTSDRIQMPDQVRFHDSESYYAVLLHELTHWTGNSSRCNRCNYSDNPQEAYAFEELVAELGASFLCADLGITASPREDHAAYLASWLKAIQSDPKVLFKAASLASTAAEYVVSPVELASNEFDLTVSATTH